MSQIDYEYHFMNMYTLFDAFATYSTGKFWNSSRFLALLIEMIVAGRKKL